MPVHAEWTILACQAGSFAAIAARVAVVLGICSTSANSQLRAPEGHVQGAPNLAWQYPACLFAMVWVRPQPCS